MTETSHMRFHPVNPAEPVIAVFFDPALSPESEWRLETRFTLEAG